MGTTTGPARPPERFGPFVLERRLGAGGAGEVHLARPSVGTRPAPVFVIKRPLTGGDPARDFEALSHEAALNQAVVHPNVVRVFGAGMVGDRPYLALEYVEGVDAHRLVRALAAAGARLPVELSVHVGRAVAAALGAVHAARAPDGALGLVHGDVSPSNVYLSVAGEVKLGDFGIARTLGEASEAAVGEVRGKWAYVAPEQLDGGPVDPRSDLFSLAAVVGELLIGERVFAGESPLATLLAIREGDCAPLRRHGAAFPAGLLAVLERALAPDPAARWATAGDLADALSAFAPASAEEASEALGSWVRRANDPELLAARIERRVRDSVSRRAAVTAEVESGAPDSLAEPRRAPAPAPGAGRRWQLRRAGGELEQGLPFAALVERIVTGELGPDDEVAPDGAPLRAIAEQPELARHLLPSTSAATSVVYGPGIPDHAVELAETPAIALFAWLRERRETGAVLIERVDPDRAGQSRREVYVEAGRLHHVASTAREELLGEQLVRRGRLSPSDLARALARIGEQGGSLGDTLVDLGLLDEMSLFRAIRDQGRDRLAAILGWRDGRASFYRGNRPAEVRFPLDLDLATAMLAGVLAAADGEGPLAPPPGAARVAAGPRWELARDRRERGTSPAVLQRLPEVAVPERTVAELAARLGVVPAGARAVTELEGRAAIRVAEALGWLVVSR